MMPDQGPTPNNPEDVEIPAQEDLTPATDEPIADSAEEKTEEVAVAEESVAEPVTGDEVPVAEEASEVEEVEEEPVEAVALVEEESEEAGEAGAEDGGDDEAGGEEEFVDEEDSGDSDAASGLLEEILGDHENLDSLVEKSSPLELALLMETIAERGKVGEFISKVGVIKRNFDQKTDEEKTESSLLERFSTSLARFNRKRTAYYAEREKEKEDNSQKKYALLERLKDIVQKEEVTKIQEVRAIQNEWRETGWVLQKDIQPLNETYRQYLDLFYNLRSKYQDLLDLDREYNQKEKEQIIAKIEALIPGEEGTRELWNERSQQVRALQNEWKSAGHVPREVLDEINSSYRNVLDRFYEMRAGYYEIQDQQKGENAVKKRELLEQLKVYADFQSRKAKDWNAATKAVLEIQNTWKGIGPGPLEENKQLWKDYRSLCDKFFEEKGNFFKRFDNERGDNLKKKIEICEKAEELSQSDDWSATAKALKDLQSEWKTIGPVHERHSNKIWKRFRKACDTFFDRRSESMSSDRAGFEDNLKAKEAMIKELKELADSDDPASGIDQFNELQARWKATGHVPFKVKDKINNAFKEAIGKFFEKTNLGRGEVQRLKMEANINSIGNEDARERRIKGEMRKIRSRLSAIKEKVDQYELNIQYIAKGKKGDPLRNQIQGQIDSEKGRMEDLKKKLKHYKHLLENPPGADEEE